MAEAWVYMLRCADGSLYTGWSSDVRPAPGPPPRRQRQPLHGQPPPVELALALADARTASAARREEARIKRLDRAGKLALIAAGAGGGVGGALRR